MAWCGCNCKNCESGVHHAGEGDCRKYGRAAIVAAVVRAGLFGWLLARAEVRAIAGSTDRDRAVRRLSRERRKGERRQAERRGGGARA